MTRIVQFLTQPINLAELLIFNHRPIVSWYNTIQIITWSIPMNPKYNHMIYKVTAHNRPTLFPSTFNSVKTGCLHLDLMKAHNTTILCFKET